MKLIIVKNNEKYELSFWPMTQFVGTNIPLKKFIIDSLCKHFSSDKYKEYEDIYIDNILLDGDVPGRKQWESYRISGKEDIINNLQIGKTSIVAKCIKQYIANYDCQDELLQIDEILLHIFEGLNSDMFPGKNIELDYEQESLFSMIQKMDVKTKDGSDIHMMNMDDLFDSFLYMVEKQQTILPEKRLYVFENIDHMVSLDKYHLIMERCKALSEQNNIWFIFSSSIKGYIHIKEDLLSGVNVINNEIFTFPEYDKFCYFIKNNYPIEINWEEPDVYESLEEIAHLICRSNGITQPQNEVILKMINESMGIKIGWKEQPKIPEMRYLLG